MFLVVVPSFDINPGVLGPELTYMASGKVGLVKCVGWVGKSGLHKGHTGPAAVLARIIQLVQSSGHFNLVASSFTDIISNYSKGR